MKRIIALVGMTLLFAGTALGQQSQFRRTEEGQIQKREPQKQSQAQQKPEQEKRMQQEITAQQSTVTRRPDIPSPPVPPSPGEKPDPFSGALFPPELIMQHQRQIELTTEQRDKIRAIIREIQPQFQDLQWQIQDATETMRELLERPSVDEATALAQLNKILDAERQVKRLQVTLMIRIKNTLTTAQVKQLTEIRAVSKGRFRRMQ